MELCLFSLLVFAAVTSAETEFKIDPDQRTYYVPKENSQTLTCILNNSPDKATLKWEIPRYAEAYPDRIKEKVQTDSVNPDGTYNIKRALTIENYSNVLDGTYTCKYSVGSSEKTTTIVLQEVEAKMSDETYYFGNKSVTLFCEISGMFGADAKLEYVWRKGDVDLEEGEKYSVNKVNHSLTINKLDRDDAGLYTLIYMHLEHKGPGTVNNISCPVEYKAGPLVLDMEKSINSIEEEEVHIYCVVKGYPKAEVTWHVRGEELVASERVSFKSHEDFEKARLVIRDLEFADEADYTCRAHSVLFNETAEKSIKLRVKDKLAWLYPSITIVVEIVVLVILVLVFDKLKKKKDE